MIYANIALALLAAGAAMVDTTEAAAGSVRRLNTFVDFKSRFNKMPPVALDDGNEGDEGNEGNEGFDFFKPTGNDGDEGDEGDEGNEGDEGEEGDEGDEGNEGDEGDEGNEGQAGIDCGVWHTHRAVTATNIRDLRVSTREQCLAACKARADCQAATFNGSGCWLRKDLKALVVDTTKSTYVLCPGEAGANEGDEGDEGGFSITTSGSTASGATCTAHSSATAFSTAKSAHILALAQSYDLLCHPVAGTHIDEEDVKVIWDVPAFATARAISDASGVCTSYGTAFGCAKAKSQAAAWAAATAEAHAGAYAEAFNGCGICKDTAVEASASAEVYASTFVQLMADVYSKAEIEVCVAGTQSASATAWSMCFADAFARLNAKAVANSLVNGNCELAHAQVFVNAVTEASYTNIQGCAQKDSSSGNASGSTGGSTAESLSLAP